MWRIMGAKVGRNCMLQTGLVGAWDCISIGDDTSISADTQIPCASVENGWLIIGRVDIGSRCFIGAHSALGLDVRMGDDSRLDDQSFLPDSEAIPSGEYLPRLTRAQGGGCRIRSARARRAACRARTSRCSASPRC